jgi:hypothetical protein
MAAAKPSLSSVAHAEGDQLELVAEVVVQDPVRELGVLGDVAQAGAGITQLGQSLQGSRGELRPAFGELVHLPARDPVPVLLLHLGQNQGPIVTGPSPQKYQGALLTIVKQSLDKCQESRESYEARHNSVPAAARPRK